MHPLNYVKFSVENKFWNFIVLHRKYGVKTIGKLQLDTMSVASAVWLKLKREY